jgi:AraC family transcriptional regulator
MLFDRPRTIRPGTVTAPAVRAIRELSQLDNASSLVLESLALELMAHALRHDSHTRQHMVPAWLSQVRYLLETDDSPPALAAVARWVGLHPVYLARAFRVHCGCSVGEYVRRRRVARSCERLAFSDMPLSEIALASGFHDQSHFSRVFQRYTAMSPGAYRRALRVGSDDAIRVRRVLDLGMKPLHPKRNPARE